MMRSQVTARVALVGLTVGLVSSYGCTADDGGGPSAQAGSTSSAAGAAGSSGSTGASGSPGVAGSGTGGSLGAAGSAAGGASAGASGQATGGSGGGGAGDITKVWKSDGFGKPFVGTSGAEQTLATSGVKAADCAAVLKDKTTKVCGPWALDRKYRVYMPQNYDPNKSYPLLFEGPGCGGGADGLYQFDASFLNTVIRVGLQPSRIEAHGTNPDQGCFDDKEGDDSMDWVFYELLYDKLNAQLSFDRNRVFSAGNSSGSWFSNELGCKYAGDALRPVRGVLPNTGGLPTDPAFVPTCTNAGMAGMWVHEVDETTNFFAGNVVAIDRAMKVNKCTQQNYASAEFEDFPVPGAQPANPCKRIKNCDPLFPLVVCALPGANHDSHTQVVLPGFPKFIGLFSMPPLAAP